MRRRIAITCAIVLLGVLAVVRATEKPTSSSEISREAPSTSSATAPVTRLTHLLVVDDDGRPVPNLPLWEGEPVTTSRTDTDGVMRDVNAGRALGMTDAAGVFVPETLPLTVNTSPWPSNPDFLVLTDTGGAHRLTVASACTVALTWDRPEDPKIVGIELGDVARSAIAGGRAELTVPCGETTVSTETLFAESARLEPEPATIDSRVASAHITWLPRDFVTICVTDEAGARLEEAEVLLAWPTGDCWGFPYPTCATISAPGFLRHQHCPESEFDWWQADRYTVALEASIKVAVRCDPAPCPKRLGSLNCVSDATPDLGSCKDLVCECPDAPDARVIAHAGEFAGESAPVRDGIATLAHTGTATLVVPGTEWCNAMVLREERDGFVVAGKMECADGRAVADRLVAGKYRLTTYTACGSTSWTDIEVQQGRENIAHLTLPDGHAVEMDADVGMTIVLHGNYRADAFGPLPADCPVPRGATLWACKEAGCCRIEDPPERATCAPDARLTPPMPADLRL